MADAKTKGVVKEITYPNQNTALEDMQRRRITQGQNGSLSELRNKNQGNPGDLHIPETPEFNDKYNNDKPRTPEELKEQTLANLGPIQTREPQQGMVESLRSRTEATNPYAVDQNRQLGSMTDPIAYRQSYDQNNIIGNQQDVNQNNETENRGEEQQSAQQNTESSNETASRGEAQDGGIIYGRGSGDENNKIETRVDPYSWEEVSAMQRQSNYESLLAMNDYDIALMEVAGYSLYGETAMRDLAKNNPDKYQRIQEQKKLIKQGDMVNAIASGETGAVSTQTNNATQSVNDSIDKWASSNSNERTYSSTLSTLTGILANNQNASTAKQEMLNLNAQIAEIEQQIKDLPNTVRKDFKGDVPQYIYEARIANEGQRLQAELNKLESRFNSALDIYKTEMSYAQWQAEMELKTKDYNFKVNQQNWENAYKISQQQWEQEFKTRQQNWTEQYQANSLLLNNIKTDKNGKPYIINPDGTYQYLSDATYEITLRGQIDKAIEGLNATYQDGTDGGQCEAFTDSFDGTVFGKTMVPVDENGNPIQGRTWTYASEKVKYVTDPIPEVGMTAIFKYPYTANVSNDAKLYGHTMKVIGYDPTSKTITLKGSNKRGDQKVYTTEMTLDEFYNKKYGAGFWAPWKKTGFELEQEGNAVATTGYTRAYTPMTTTINSLKEDASTASQLDTIATAEFMYDVMYELNTEGYTDALINSGVMEDFLNSLDRKNFGKQGDERGSYILEQMSQYLNNEIKDEKVYYAFNRLYSLVEKKLRAESGAAINSSEWAMNFKLFLPSAGQSPEMRKKIIQQWDDIIYKDFASAGLKQDQYVPLFNQQQIDTLIFAG